MFTYWEKAAADFCFHSPNVISFPAFPKDLTYCNRDDLDRHQDKNLTLSLPIPISLITLAGTPAHYRIWVPHLSVTTDPAPQIDPSPM